MTDLEARKRALVAESEVYRQTLTLEIQNLRLYGVRFQRKFAVARLANPLILAATSWLASRWVRPKSTHRKRQGKWSRLFGASLMGWRLYRQFGPVLQSWIFRRKHFKHAPEPGQGYPVRKSLV